MAIDASIKNDFPIFRSPRFGKKLVYLDSTASSQKPAVVIEAERKLYEEYYANVHRGIYQLSEASSDAYEQSRETIARFIGAPSREIIFTRNATESLNLIAFTWGRQHIAQGDELLLTEMEHHANLVPWQQLAAERGAKLKFIPITADGRLDVAALPTLLTKATKLVSLTHMSNVLGTVNPVKDIIGTIRRFNKDIVIVIDGAQSVPHFAVDMTDIGADFYAFSSHKMLGPTGVGVLWGRADILEAMPPFMTGGDMISHVTYERSEWNELPFKFEAGTPNIAGVIGLAAAVEYLQKLGMADVFAHEREMTKLAMAALKGVGGITIYGPNEVADRGGVLAFTVAGVHPHDVASILDEQGICIRAGHHCAQPLHQRLGVDATARASFYVYNTPEDIDALVTGLAKAKEIFSV